MAAAILSSALGEVASLLGGTSIGATLGRGALTGIGAVAASDLIGAIQRDISGGGSAAATARRVPQYAIVDLHTNKVVRFLSTHKVYVLLTHGKRRRRGYRQPRIVTVPSGSQIVEVK